MIKNERIEENNIVNISFFCVVLFLLIRFWSPIFLSQESLINQLYTNGSKAVSGFIIIFYLINSKFNNPIFWCTIGLFLSRLLSTLIYSPANLQRVFMTSYPIIAIIALNEILMFNAPRLYLRSFDVCLKSLCLPNAILSIVLPSLFQDGVYYRYVIGGENQIVFAYFVSVLLSYIEHCRHNSKFFYLYISILTISILRIFSAGNLLGWFAFMIACCLYYIRNVHTAKGAMIAAWTAWISIVVLRVQNLFRWLIEDILHKDMTLTNRTIVWDMALEKIKAHPILGYGFQETVNVFYVYRKRIGKPTVDSHFSAHNQLVQTLYESGLLSVVPIIVMMWFVAKKLDKFRTSRLFPLFVSLIIGDFVSLMAEAPSWDSFFVIMMIAYHIDDIDSIIKENTKLGSGDNNE